MGRKRPLAVHIRFGVQGKSTLVQCRDGLGVVAPALVCWGNTDSRATGSQARPFYRWYPAEKAWTGRGGSGKVMGDEPR